MLAQDFSHGWQSGPRVYRIEAAIGVASEHLYTFSIDGVKFIEFPYKREVDLRSSTSPVKTTPTRKSSIIKEGGGSASKHSNHVSSSSSPPDRGHFQSPDSFDPFESSSDPFDPFEDNKRASVDKKKKKKIPAPPKAPTPVAKQRNASVSLKPAPQVVNKQQLEPNFFDEVPSHPSAAATLFDPFDDAPQPQKTDSVDLFSQTSQSSFDPFAPTTTHPTIANNTDNFRSSNSVSNDDLFAGFSSSTTAAKRNESNNILDLFGPTESNSNLNPPVAHNTIAAFGIKESSNFFDSTFDNFDSAPVSAASTSTSDFLFTGASSTARTDLFASEATLTGTNSAQWNASTLSDFAGLSFEATAPEAIKEAAVTVPVQIEPAPVAVQDPWKTSNLVDLDLSGKDKVLAKKPVLTATSLSSMLQDGSFTTAKSPQSSMLLPKSTGLTPPGPYGNASVSAYGTGLTPSFATGTGLAPVFPPSLPVAMQPAFQPPVYGRGLGNTASVASPPSLGPMAGGSPPVQAYGTGLGGGFAPTSNHGLGLVMGAQPIAGGMNRPAPGMGMNPGYGGTGLSNDYSMNNGMGVVGLRPPALAPRPADPHGIMAGGKGNSINIRGSTTTNTVTAVTTSPSISTSSSLSTNTAAGKDILTFNGLGVLPSPRKVNQPVKTSLDSINWRG